MNSLSNKIHSLRRGKRSALATVEYGVLLGVASIGTLAGMNLLSGQVNALYANIAAQLAAVALAVAA